MADRLFPKRFWASLAPEPGQEGDATEADVYAAVGLALSSWEKVHDNLASAFIELCQLSSVARDKQTGLRILGWPERVPYEAARRVFAAAESTPAKIALLDAVAEVYFGPYWTNDAIRRPFHALTGEVRKASLIRNEIAHGVVVNEVVGIYTEKGREELKPGCFLVAADYATHRHIPYYADDLDPMSAYRNKYRYTSVDISVFAEKFEKLVLEIFSYRVALRHPVCLS